MPDADRSLRSPHDRGAPRWGWAACVAVFVGAFAGLGLGWLGSQLALLRGESGDEPAATNGWVEAPSGVDLSTVRLIASRAGRNPSTTTPAPDGTFRLLVPAGGVFDLHASDWVSWRDPYPLDGSPPPPEPTHAIEGGLQDVPFGAVNVRVPLARVALVDATVRVRGADGAPVSGTWVHLASHGDRVEQTTDAQGLARFRRLPPRLWHAAARAPGDERFALLTGSTDFVPSEEEVQVRIPEGVEVRVRLGEGVSANFLNAGEIPHTQHLYAMVPWRPGADGTMTLWVPPDLATLAIRAVQRDRLDDRTTREWPVAAGAVAVRAGVTLTLEPLGR